MSTLCFGGSFNPIHHGHLICARRAAEALGMTSVAFIPSANPPHKPGSMDLAPGNDRLQMCRRAIEGRSGFELNDLEMHRTGPSYTIDTVRELARRGWGRVTWLIGADLVRFLPTWHEPDALLEEVAFVVLARPGWLFDWDALSPKFRALRDRVVEAPLIEISASGIRQRVRTGLPIDFLTPDPVVDYIRSTGLYRAEP